MHLFWLKQELNWKPHAKVFAPLQFSIDDSSLSATNDYVGEGGSS